ncbi:MAG TPA: hypothetical protein VFB82_19615 [Blastocatellia bacterium]|nr:hypothetical protein [Blastocatellia bacterium]
MTNEEIQRTMEFILEGQARFDARVAKDEERVVRLEEAFLMLVEIARITDERQDETDQRISRFDEKLTALADAQLVSQSELTELTKGLNSLINIVERYISNGHN